MGKRWQRGGFVASVAGAVRFARTTPSSSRRSSAWKAQMKCLDITGDQFHPEWNYTIRPRPP
jgi:hypothetical protein